jgi:hypothetical protein
LFSLWHQVSILEWRNWSWSVTLKLSECSWSEDLCSALLLHKWIENINVSLLF